MRKNDITAVSWTIFSVHTHHIDETRAATTTEIQKIFCPNSSLIVGWNQLLYIYTQPKSGHMCVCACKELWNPPKGKLYF